jgi:uncharacterized Zn finger protein (UPF0148 family)
VQNPTYKDIGLLDDECPTCRHALTRRPDRKAKCPHCGAAIYVRQRPMDEARVLLSEAELPALEEEWQKQFKWSQKQPREVDPVWAARIEDAREAGPHWNPMVEIDAQRIMARAMEEIRKGEAPREAFESLIAALPDERRELVDKRVWQLKVQAMFGKSR